MRTLPKVFHRQGHRRPPEGLRAPRQPSAGLVFCLDGLVMGLARGQQPMYGHLPVAHSADFADFQHAHALVCLHCGHRQHYEHSRPHFA